MVATDQQRQLKSAIAQALGWIENQNVRVPPALADLVVYHGIKTADFYLRVLYTWINDLLEKEVSEGEFVDKMADLVEQQLTRAWNEGMRANDLDPVADMDEDLQAQLTDIITSEYMFVDGFASDIASGNYTLAQLQSRAAIWANRYNEVVNKAKLASADLADKYEWVYGDAEHCETCAALNGIVASAKEWEISGLQPQNPPNDFLDCGGWRCQCQLRKTDRRRTPKALDALLTIGMG